MQALLVYNGSFFSLTKPKQTDFSQRASQKLGQANREQDDPENIWTKMSFVQCKQIPKGHCVKESLLELEETCVRAGATSSPDGPLRLKPVSDYRGFQILTHCEFW